MADEPKKWWQRPGILASVIIGVLLLTAVPYAQSVRREYNRFAEYSKATLHGSETPPWDTKVFSPEDCVVVSMEWLAACPGIDDFCIDGAREVTRRCIKSQDRKAWCEAQRENWATTNFGYTWCKEREAQVDGERLIG